jgi:hypothetical protein
MDIILVLFAVLNGCYWSYYTLGCTAQHRERKGKLFIFPKNPMQYVHKILEHVYDHLVIYYTTHFWCHTEFINVNTD